MSKPLFDTKGMQQFGPGCFFDPKTDTMHLDAVAICRALNMEPTQENQKIVSDAAADIFNEEQGKTFERIEHFIDPKDL